LRKGQQERFYLSSQVAERIDEESSSGSERFKDRAGEMHTWHLRIDRSDFDFATLSVLAGERRCPAPANP